MTKTFTQKAIEQFLMLITGGRQKYLRMLPGTVPDGRGGREWGFFIGIDSGKGFRPLVRVLTHREASGWAATADLPGFDVAQDDDTMNGMLDDLVGHNLDPESLVLFFETRSDAINPETDDIDSDDIVRMLRDGGQ